MRIAICILSLILSACSLFPEKNKTNNVKAILCGNYTVYIYKTYGKVGFINSSKKVIIPANKYDHIDDYVEYGLLRTDIGGHKRSNGCSMWYDFNKVGAINLEGEVVFEPQFRSLRFGHHGIGLAEHKNGLFGYVDNKGNYCTDFIFDEIEPFKNNHTVVIYKNKYGLIDTSFQYILQPEYTHLALSYETDKGTDTLLLITSNDSITESQHLTLAGEIIP